MSTDRAARRFLTVNAGSTSLKVSVVGPDFSTLEQDPTRPMHLVTEPGVGYRFEP